MEVCGANSEGLRTGVRVRPNSSIGNAERDRRLEHEHMECRSPSRIPSCASFSVLEEDGPLKRTISWSCATSADNLTFSLTLSASQVPPLSAPPHLYSRRHPRAPPQRAPA